MNNKPTIDNDCYSLGLITSVDAVNSLITALQIASKLAPDMDALVDNIRTLDELESIKLQSLIKQN
tara:strand:+ start:52 stop:249 length:198 start_codon:yes stop_codon:yes gene_type:complete